MLVGISNGSNTLMFKGFKNYRGSIHYSDFLTAISILSVDERVINIAFDIIEYPQVIKN